MLFFLCAMGVIFAGLVMLIKSGKMKEVYMDVEKKANKSYRWGLFTCLYISVI